MKNNAFNQGMLRASTAGIALALFISPALAQLRPTHAATMPPRPPAPIPPPPRRRRRTAPQRTIQHINVTGTQRIEPATVLTYIALREGDPYDPPRSTRR